MLLGIRDAYEILGIDQDADTKTIKRAYAELVKQYHPEEQPEEWKRIHDAYELAIRSSEQAGRRMSSEQTGSQIASEQTGQEDIFADIEERAQKQQSTEDKEYQGKFDSAMNEIRRITWHSKMKLSDWKTFFEQADILPIVSQGKLLREMGDGLTLQKINGDIYNYLNKQLDSIADFLKTVRMDIGNRNMSEVEYVRTKNEEGYRRWKAFKRERKRKVMNMTILALFILIFFLLIHIGLTRTQY